MRTENRCMWPGKQVSSTVSTSINSLCLIPNLPLQFTLLIPLSPGDLPLVTFSRVSRLFWYQLFLHCDSFHSFHPFSYHLQPLFCLSFSLLCPRHFKAKRNSQKPPHQRCFILSVAVGKPGIAVLWFPCVRSTITHPHLRANNPNVLSLQTGRY